MPLFTQSPYGAVYSQLQNGLPTTGTTGTSTTPLTGWAAPTTSGISTQLATTPPPQPTSTFLTPPSSSVVTASAAPATPVTSSQPQVPPTSTSPAAPPPAPKDYNKDAAATVSAGLAAGADWANSVLPDGSLSRLNDPRAAEMNALLAALKERTGGMTSQEMLAAKEQGLAGMDQQLATNLRRMGQIAGSAGVRGGAAAGLSANAINQNNQQRAMLERQMILDNIAQKNQAFAQYGSALVGQQGRELGIQEYNAGKTDKEKLGRIGLGVGHWGLVDSEASSRRAEDTAAEGRKTATDFQTRLLDLLGKPGSTAPTDPTKPVESRDTKSVWTSIVDEIKNTTAGDRATFDGLNFTPAGVNTDSIKSKIEEFVDLSFPNLTEAERKDRKNQLFRQAFAEANPEWTMPSSYNAFKIICTEARRQRFLTSEELATSHRFGMRFMSPQELHAYHTWARPVVERMRKSPRLAWAISKLLHPLIKAEGDMLQGSFYKSTILGHLIMKAFRYMNRRTMARLANGAISVEQPKPVIMERC